MNTLNIIKKTALAIFVTFAFSLSTVLAQNDTMYIMKAGVVVGQYNVNTEIDSVIFYNPTTDSSTTVIDNDGNVYNTVTIGSQVWMKENLRTTTYADGTPIPHVTGDSNWDTLDRTDKAYCYHNDDSATNASTYGALYTWAAAMNGSASTTNNPSAIQGVCPKGWHLPSDDEWIELENHLADNGYNYDGTIGGGRDKIAKAMAASSGWNTSSNTGAVGNTDYPAYRNKSGFTALPANTRDGSGTFYDIGGAGFWWSATEYDAIAAWIRSMLSGKSNIKRLGKPLFGSYLSQKERGFSVRCLQD